MSIPQPTPDVVFSVREAAGLSQAEAAALVHLGGKYRWSEYERGVRQMDGARWELFLAKTGQHPSLGPKARRS